MKTPISTSWKNIRSQSAFSLVELIVAMTLFLVIIAAALPLIDTATKATEKVNMSRNLSAEANILMTRLVREIEKSTIDYEEYYSRYAIGDLGYGNNYGQYHAQFFNPTTGFETGQNPYAGSGGAPEDANAMCKTGSICSGDLAYFEVNELFLINGAGNERTYFALENDAFGNNALAMVGLEGSDTDENGLIDTWACAADFTCTAAGNLPNPADFRPVIGKNMVIDSLTFYISPIEDPFKGYNETTAEVWDSVQIQPNVTIVMTASYQIYNKAGNPVAFSDSAFKGNAPIVTLQRIAKTGLTNTPPTVQ